MKKYYIKKDGHYINYILSFNEFLKLKSTTPKTSGNRISRMQPHIIYTEQEAKRVLCLEKDAYLVPVED
jgi:hypothetical protein